ncbi:MAG: hypothetical protein ACE5HI_06325, partial [bacterium]
GAIDAGRSLVTGGARKRFVQEGIANFTGTFKGMRSGASEAVKVLMDENKALEAQGGLRGAELLMEQRGAIPGVIGKIIRFPFRVVSAPDAFYRTAGRNASQYSIATRMAMKEGHTGVELQKRIAKIIESQDEAFLAEAEAEVLNSVFQKPLTGVLATIQHAREQGLGTAFRLVVPFFRTPIRLAEFGLKRIPLASMVLPAERRALVNAFRGSPEQFEEVLSRWFLGGSMIGAFTYEARQGNITGRPPEDAEERDLLYRNGWRPYSIRVGKQYFSYRGLEPLSTFLGFAADVAGGRFADQDEETFGRMLGRVSSGMADNFLNQPFLFGINSMLDAVDDPENKGQFFINNVVTGSTIPNLMRQIAVTVDPTVRSPENLSEAIMSQIPGLTKKVPPRTTVFGDPVVRQGGEVWGQFFATRHTEEEVSELENELVRLKLVQDFDIGFTSKRLDKVPFAIEKVNGEIIQGFVNMSLSQDESNIVRFTAGQAVKNSLAEAIQNPEYQSLDDTQRIKFIQRQVESAREDTRELARRQFFQLRWERLSKKEKLDFIRKWEALEDDKEPEPFPVLKSLEGRE